MNSIKTTHIDFIIGIFDLLPKAKRMLNGNAKPIPVTPKKSVTSRPPHLFVPTVLNPGPPYNMKYAINGKRKVKYMKSFRKGNLSKSMPIIANGSRAYVIFTLHVSLLGKDHT